MNNGTFVERIGESRSSGRKVEEPMGKYRVEGDELVLEYESGNEQEFTIKASDLVSADGKIYFQTMDAEKYKQLKAIEEVMEGYTE